MYLRRKPHASLLPYVESIGLQQSDALPIAGEYTRILPTGTADLVFHYGDRFVQLTAEGESLEPRAYVTGQRTRLMDVAATGRTGIVVVNLLPWGLAAFFDAPASSFANGTLDLSCLVDRHAIHTLIEKLESAGDPTERLDLVEDFLLSRLLARERDRRVQYAATRINQQLGHVRTAAVANEVGLSKRQLDRRFLREVGITPKAFSRVIRLQKALCLIRKGTSSLADVATALGYYDQPHMNHEFQLLSGITPDGICRQRDTTALMQSYNSRELSHFYNTLYLS